MPFAAINHWPVPLRRSVVAAAAVAVVLSMVAHATAQSPGAEADVGSLARALEMQLRLMYRANLPEYTRRSEQLEAATRAWAQSPRSAADQDQIVAWLRQSIRQSMPGSTSPLPPRPQFAASRPAGEPLPPSVQRTGRAVAQGMGVERLAPQPAANRWAEESVTPPARREAAKPIGEPADAARENEAPSGPSASGFDEHSLLDSHPAADQWPLELTEGDPFLDDPLPPESQ